jgi:hypothetical protein
LAKKACRTITLKPPPSGEATSCHRTQKKQSLTARKTLRGVWGVAILCALPHLWAKLASGGDLIMRTRAAVAVAAGKPLQIMEVNLDDPKEGEVLVEIKATGICHTDEFTLSGADPEGIFPSILGHEGAGVVIKCGPGVTSLKPGDHVIPLYTPECR